MEIDLYGGTRHSSTTALRDNFTPGDIRRAGTLHTTNKAFDRYLQFNKNDALEIYKKANSINSKNRRRHNIVNMKIKRG